MLALFKDSDVNALAVRPLSFPTIANRRYSMGLTYEMTAGTTDEIIFRMRAGGSTGSTTTFNGVSGGREFGGVANSFIKVTEVMQ